MFATDTHYIPYKFKGLSNIMIECNYEGNIIRENADTSESMESRLERVVYSHIELETCKDFLENNDMSMVNNIILLHLSDSNSHAVRFKKEIENLTGKQVYVADKGLEVNLNGINF